MVVEAGTFECGDRRRNPKGVCVKRVGFVLTSLLALIATARGGSGVRSAPRPNVVIFLADDMGYSDLGCYGGEVHTPNLDRLSKEGLRFTQFYNTTRCWPSRAAILTGYYAQQVRRDEIPGMGPAGGQGIRPAWARLLPEYLRAVGYRSYHSGKWHVDGKPTENGFDRSYWLEDTDRHFNPKVHFEDDHRLPPVAPDSGYYSTTNIAEHAISCLKDHAANYKDRPFFSYVAFISPHFPIMAPAADIEKYKGRFRDGWDKLREQRLQRMKKLGIVDCGLSARTPGVPAWETLPEADKEMWQARMEVHAAMVDRMDHEIGRVVAQLKQMHQLDNTVIFFLSDNGASAEKVLRGDGNAPDAAPGSARSFLCIEPGWANLCNSPLRRSKIFTHEGGISTSLIVHWPRGISAHGELRRNVGHVIDLAPTILELAGGTSHREIPAPGRSLVPAFARDGAVDRDSLWWYHSGNRAFRVGDWKIVAEGEKTPWELYDLKSDRSETRDLAGQFPERVREMREAWAGRLGEIKRVATRP